MVAVQITFDLDNPDDRRRVRRLIDEIERTDSMRSTVVRGAATSQENQDEGDEQRVRELLEDYGETRRDFVRAVAKAAPNEVTKESIYGNDENQFRSVGGVRSSLERSWRRLGGDGEFIETTRNGFRMRARLAALCLKVLDDN